jgi:hypothetical protein
MSILVSSAATLPGRAPNITADVAAPQKIGARSFVPRRVRTVVAEGRTRLELTRLDEEEPETIEQHRSEERRADTQP